MFFIAQSHYGRHTCGIAIYIILNMMKTLKCRIEFPKPFVIITTSRTFDVFEILLLS